MMRAELNERGTDVGAAPRTAAHEGVRRLAALLRDARLMLLALWLGASLFFGAVVAPAAFAVLRARGVPYANEAAGSIVSRALSVVNVGGFFIAVLTLAAAFALRAGRRRGAFTAEAVSLFIMAAATAAGQWVIGARMLALRAQAGRPIEDLAPGDPLRAGFDSLHGYSVKALGLAMMAAVVALLLMARRK